MFLFPAMFSFHQVYGSGSGFPFMQMCHVSFLVQTLSIILIGVTLALRRVRGAQQGQSTSKDKKQKKKKGQGGTAEVTEVRRQFLF
jgi:hypothetical protein